MKIEPRPLPPSETHAARSYWYAPVRGAFFSGVLVVVQDRTRDVYAVLETDENGDEMADVPLPPFARFFLVCKLAVPSSCELSGLYRVRIGQGAGIKPSCQCFGYNRWQTCKHIDSLSDLVRNWDRI